MKQVNQIIASKCLWASCYLGALTPSGHWEAPPPPALRLRAFFSISEPSIPMHSRGWQKLGCQGPLPQAPPSLCLSPLRWGAEWGGSVSVVQRGARAPGCSPLLAPARIPQVLGWPVDTHRGAHTTQGPCRQGKAEPEGGHRQAQLQEGKAEGLYLGGLLSPREADSG